MSEHRIRAQVGVEILESAIVEYLSQPFPPNRHINGIADDLDWGGIRLEDYCTRATDFGTPN